MQTLLATIASPAPSAGGPDMTRYVLVCTLLLGLICLAAYGFKRFVATAVRTKASKRSLQVIDMLPLGGKQRMCVVRCYDRTFALGLGDKEVALIAELDASTAIAPAPKTSFASLLKREQTPDGNDTTDSAPAKRGLLPFKGLFG